jgi:RNA polymerase sigma factor (sigma-70 family)
MTSSQNTFPNPKSAGNLYLELQILRLSEGDPLAFGIIYNLTHKKLFRVALAILTDRHESEDVVQEAYLSIWRNAGDYRPASSGSSMSWLSRIARNGAIDKLRKRRHVELDADITLAKSLVDPMPDAFTELEARQQALLIAKMLDGLSLRAAAALHIAFYDDETYEAVSQQLGLPPGTIKSTIRRTLERLRPQAAKIRNGEDPAGLE